MKPTVTFKIHADIIDSYLYAGYLYLFFADSRIVYVDYHIIINELKEKYPQYANLITLIFLHNEYSKSYAAKLIFAVKEIHDVMKILWQRAAEEISFELDYSDIEKSCVLLGEWESLPLDIRMYAMRLYIGCRHGLYETNLNMDERYRLHPKPLCKCFDAKVTSINANYSSIVVSADWDGLYTGNINDATSKLRLDENKSLAKRSLRTGWTGSDILNYESSCVFKYLNNATSQVYNKGIQHQYKKADTQEQKIITKFGVTSIGMEELFGRTNINPGNIVYCFNSSSCGFFFMNDGSFCNANIRVGKAGENMYYISSRVNENKTDIHRKQKPLSSTLIPNGCVIEYFDCVVLYQSGKSYILADEPVNKVRSYMNSKNYRDIVSIVSDGGVTFHSLFTLDMINSRQAFPNSQIVAGIFSDSKIKDLPF